MVTASGRTLPALMCSIDQAMGSKKTCTCPASRSVTHGAAATIGHMHHVTPVIILNSSPETWEALPMPLDAMVSLPGLALA